MHGFCLKKTKKTLSNDGVFTSSVAYFVGCTMKWVTLEVDMVDAQREGVAAAAVCVLHTPAVFLPKRQRPV